MVQMNKIRIVYQVNQSQVKIIIFKLYKIRSMLSIQKHQIFNIPNFKDKIKEILNKLKNEKNKL